MKTKEAPIYNQSYLSVGKGPTVILLHGLFGNLSLWRRTVDVLQGNYHVIVPRLPIFDLPAQHTNIKYLVSVLHDFIEWNKLTDVILVGHGIGGQLALFYAYQHPANVHKLILTGSAGLLDNPQFYESAASDFYDREFVNQRVRKAFFKSEKAPAQLIEDVYTTVRNIPRRLTINSLIRSSRQHGVSFFLSRLDHPVLLIWGVEDAVTPPEVALHFHDFLQNSQVQFIKECGHLPMAEQPELFNSYLLSFIK